MNNQFEDQQTLSTLPETCALCSGTGSADKSHCPGCLGWGCLALGEPIVECPECSGSGDIHPPAASRERTCTICGGTGWFFPLKSPMKFESNRDASDPNSGKLPLAQFCAAPLFSDELYCQRVEADEPTDVSDGREWALVQVN